MPANTHSEEVTCDAGRYTQIHGVGSAWGQRIRVSTVHHRCRNLIRLRTQWWFWSTYEDFGVWDGRYTRTLTYGFTGVFSRYFEVYPDIEAGSTTLLVEEL